MLSQDDILQNRYKIVQAIKKGGMGQVYMAEDLRLRCFVAIKEARYNDDISRAAFAREASLLANLSHPILPKVTDRFEEGQTLYLVMEFVEGKDLSELLATRRLQLTEILNWADQILDALELLHGNFPPIIHRDIKPLNLKRTSQGRIKLLDFGLAKGAAGQMAKNDADQSMPGSTRAYASLEQINHSGTDGRSDIYSLCATLFQLLTGEIPPDAVERATSSITGQPDPLCRANELNASVPAVVADVLHQGLALNPAQRIPDATTMRRMLRDAAVSCSLQGQGMGADVLGDFGQTEETTRRQASTVNEDLPTTLRDTDIS